MSSTKSAASAATDSHVPPRGFVTPALARQAVTTIRAYRGADEDGLPTVKHLDRLTALEAEASHNPSGDALGAAFQLSVVLGILDRFEGGDAGPEDVRTAKRSVLHVLAYIGGGEPFAGYYY